MKLKHILPLAGGAVAVMVGAGLCGWYAAERRHTPSPPPPVRATARALVAVEGKPDRVETWTVYPGGTPEQVEKAFVDMAPTFAKKGWDVIGVYYGVPDLRPGPELVLTGQTDLNATARVIRASLDEGAPFVRIIVIGGPGLSTQRMQKLLAAEVKK